MRTEPSNLWSPSLDPKEFTDDREEVTEAELMAYMAVRETTPWIKAIAPNNTTFTGTKSNIKVNMTTGEYEVIKASTFLTGTPYTSTTLTLTAFVAITLFLFRP